MTRAEAEKLIETTPPSLRDLVRARSLDFSPTPLQDLCRRHGMPIAAGLAHVSPEALLLAEGSDFGPAASGALDELALEPEYLEPNHCAENAVELATDYGLDLWMGLALHTSSSEPVAHAWCLHGDGRVIDPTWGAGAAYLGIRFDLIEIAAAQLRSMKAAGIEVGAGSSELFKANNFLFLDRFYLDRDRERARAAAASEARAAMAILLPG